MASTSSPETDMDMDLKHNHSIYYHQRLFILFLSFVVLTVGCFIYGQYTRERHFKTELLNGQLQLLNIQMLSYCENGGEARVFYLQHRTLLPNLRMTLISKDGTVIYDSANPERETNHLSRPEVQRAIQEGSSYEIRHSDSVDRDFFYAATAGKNMIARSGVLYTVSLANSLQPTKGFFLLMLGLSVIFCILCYMMTRHLGDNIRRLRNFARKAGASEPIETETRYPHDELGEISNQIVKLYNRLLQTMNDRDKERQTAIHEAHEKIRIKRELTNNINHELKTPLSAIKGYLETILSYPDMNREQRELFTQKSYEQAMRLTDLLRDVSTISRLEEGNLSVKKTLVNLTDIFESLRQNMDLLPENRRMDFHCDIHEPLWMEGDVILLNSIFENLMNNALSYSSGSAIYIELTEKSDEYLSIRFSDDGVGVEDHHLPYLFDRFYRVDKGRSRKLGGTGLGLSIVKNAVLHHGGNITVCNGERGGLEFNIRLKRGQHQEVH